MSGKQRVASIGKLTRAELAQHALSKFKAITLSKAVTTKGIDLVCPFCHPPQNQFKAGDTVYMPSNRAHALHVACVKREVARAKANAATARGGNVLDTLLEANCPDTNNGNNAVITARAVRTVRDRQPEKLDIVVGSIRITISFVD